MPCLLEVSHHLFFCFGGGTFINFFCFTRHRNTVSLNCPELFALGTHRNSSLYAVHELSSRALYILISFWFLTFVTVSALTIPNLWLRLGCEYSFTLLLLSKLRSISYSHALLSFLQCLRIRRFFELLDTITPPSL